jgi:hypothetical protein
MLHQISEPGRRRVDLVVKGLVVAALGVLQQRDQQKSEEMVRRHRG